MYAQAVGNILLGSIAIIANAALMAAFLSNKRRRTTYPLLLALAFGDTLYGLAFVGYGANRLYKQLLNDTSPVSPRFCLVTVYPIVTPLSQIIIAFTTLLISLDRFLCMRMPLYYYMHIKPVKYYPYLGAVLIAASIFSCIGVHQYLFRLGTLPWHCGTPDAVSDLYNSIRFGVAAFGGLLAAAMYCMALIPVQMRKIEVNYAAIGRNWPLCDRVVNGTPLTYLRRQSKLTKEISFVIACIFLLYAVPMFHYWLLFGLKLKWPILFRGAPYAGWPTILHSTLNVVLLCIMSRDIRTVLVKTILPSACWWQNIVGSAPSRGTRRN